MGIILFEDGKVADLAPATLTRPAAMIPCGGYQLAELVQSLGVPLLHATRPHLRGTVPNVCGESIHFEDSEFVLILNARCVPSIGTLRALAEWWATKEVGRVIHEGTLVAALIPADALGQWDFDPQSLAALPDFDSTPVRELTLPLLDHPHEIIQYHLELLADNLAHRLQQGNYTEAAAGTYLGPAATIHPSATVDASEGIILLEPGATVGPYSYLRGPLHLGPESVVLPHASIGTHVAAENNCKLGGEVSCSVISSYSNKAHFGFLGHSYLGSWVNLGAGTTNSNLKNTYGEVSVQSGTQRVATGMQFLGCLIGDYTKTAIQTGILTGKMVGICNMLYGTVAENVPSFVNYAKQFGKVTAVSAEVAATIQQRTYARRGRTQNQADRQLLLDLYDLTQPERSRFAANLPVEPLVL
ncbi:MAG: putative sugar nucleotidyl transferase [Planctomycetota bacterium]|nr:putative sugar nucleotidyl transferase [Planctomycetota bacterium]